MERLRRPRGGLRTGLLLLVGLVVLAGIIALSAVLWRSPGESSNAAVVESPAVNVEVELVRPFDELVDAFELKGVVEPRRIVSISAEVDGRVEGIERKEGDNCASGDVLIRLNRDILQAEYDQALAQAEFDRREYERVAELAGRGVATSNELDQARTKAAASKARFDLAKAHLDRAVIASPTDGIINRIPVEFGEYVKSGACVAQIVQLDTVKVVVEVSESDVNYLKVGDPAGITIDAAGDLRMEGTIGFISETADERSRTTRVEIQTDNRHRRVRAGQIVTVALQRRVLNDVIMVPLSAVIPLEEGYAVYVVNGEEADRRLVKMGFIKGDRCQVVSGLEAGDRLILNSRLVGPGQRVVVRDQRQL